MTGNKLKTILITGINGFLGSHLSKKLSETYNIIGLEYKLDNLFRLEGCEFKIYESKYEILENIFLKNNIYAVIHAATIYRKKNEPIEQLINTNIILPIKLYELAGKHNVLLFLNTDSFFNQSNTKYKYLSDYTLSKKHVLEWLRLTISNCKLINMKLFHIYGPDDAPDKFVPTILRSLKNNVKAIDLTKGEQKRDFIFVDDAVNAYNTILENQCFFKDNYYEFEVGSGHSFSIKEFITLTKDIFDSTTILNFGKIPYRENEIMNVEADISSLKSLGWKPMIKLSEGLIKILEII